MDPNGHPQESNEPRDQNPPPQTTGHMADEMMDAYEAELLAERDMVLARDRRQRLEAELKKHEEANDGTNG